MQILRKVKSLRALASLSVGLLITFWQSHHEVVGLVALSIFTLLYGMRTLFATPRYLPIALIALFTAFLSATSLDKNFVLYVALWGFAQCAIDLINRDAIGAGLAFLLALLFATIPMDSVSAVGFFGAYLMLSGVHLGIAAYSKK